MTRVQTLASGLKSSAERAASALRITSSSLDSTGTSGQRTASGLERSSSAADRLSRSMASLKSRVAEVNNNLEKTQDKLDKVQGGAQKVTAVAGAVAGVSIYNASDYQELINSIKNTAQSPEEAQKLTKWVQGGQNVSYSSGLQRARAAGMLSAGVMGGLQGSQSSDLQIEFLENLERTLAVQGSAADDNIRTLAGASSLLQTFTTGSTDALNDLIPGFQMNNTEISKLRDKYRETTPELANFTDEQIDLYIGMKEANKIMKEANAGKEEVVASTVKLRMAYEKLSVQLGMALLPTFDKLVEGLGKVTEIATRYPDATRWVALGLVFAFLGGSAVILAGQVVGAMVTIQGLGGVAAAVSAPMKILTAVQWALNAAMTANPIGIIIVAGAALVAILIYLAHRSGLLANAWERLKAINVKEALAPDIEDLKARWGGLMEWIDGVEARIDGLKGRLKGLSTGQILKGALSVGMTVTLPGMIMTALGVKTPALLTWIHDGLMDLREDMEDWFEGLLPDWFTEIIEWLKGVWQHLKDILASVSGWYDKIKSFIMGGKNDQGVYEPGLAEKIGDQIVSAFRSVPILGGQVTDQIASQIIQDAKSKGKSEEETLMSETGVERFRGKSHSGEVKVATEFEAKDLYKEDMKDRYGSEVLSFSEWHGLDEKDQKFFEPKTIVSMEIEGAEALGYDMELAKAIHSQWASTGTEASNSSTAADEAEDRGAAKAAAGSVEFETSAGTVGIDEYGRAELGGGAETTEQQLAEAQKEVVGIDMFGRPIYAQAAEGAEIKSDGGIIVHEGEQIPPARVVQGTKTVFEKLLETLKAPALPSPALPAPDLERSKLDRGVGSVGTEDEARSQSGGVRASYTVLEKLVDMAIAARIPTAAEPTVSPSPAVAGPEPSPVQVEPKQVIYQLIVQGPLVAVDRIDSHIDIDDLAWRLRRSLEEIGFITSGNLQGSSF